MVYRYRTIQLINTLVNIKYVHYIQHGEAMHTNESSYICKKNNNINQV